jgi:hypothetical protein
MISNRKGIEAVMLQYSSKKNFTESFGSTTIGPGYVKPRLDLNSIDNPSAYGLSFYTAESFKSNEVRDFTN